MKMIASNLCLCMLQFLVVSTASIPLEENDIDIFKGDDTMGLDGDIVVFKDNDRRVIDDLIELLMESQDAPEDLDSSLENSDEISYRPITENDVKCNLQFEIINKLKKKHRNYWHNVRHKQAFQQHSSLCQNLARTLKTGEFYNSKAKLRLG